MIPVRCCAACGRQSAPSAVFCRHCGTPFETPPLEAPQPPVTPPFDDRRLLRELTWLCVAPVVLSVAYAIELRIAGMSAIAEVVMDALVASVAIAGASRNWPLVRDALRLPTLRGIGATILVAVVVGPAIVLAFTLIKALGFGVYDGYFEPFVQDGWPLWTAFVSVAVLTPLSEELLFRGLIQPKLEQLASPTEALVVQAALFSAAHLSILILATHFAMGLAFGWVRRYTRSLLPSVVLHATWNAGVLWEAMRPP